MVDVDAKGGLQVIVQGAPRGRLPRRRRHDLHRRDPGRAGRAAGAAAAGPATSSTPSTKPFKDTGGLRLLRGNLAPDGGAILKVAGVEGGVQDGVFTGRARVFNGERPLIEALDAAPRRLPGQRHGGDPLRGTAGRPGHARAARSHLADHGAVPAAPHHHRAHDRRPLLGRIGRAGHRPRGARGASSGARSRSWRTATPSWSTSTRTASTARSSPTPSRARAAHGRLAGGGGGQRRRAPRRRSRSPTGSWPACGRRRSRPSSAAGWPRPGVVLQAVRGSATMVRRHAGDAATDPRFWYS